MPVAGRLEQKISRSSIGQGNDKCGSVRMDCFGLFTFDRRKKLCGNASTNGLLSEQNPKIMRGSRMLEVNHVSPIHPYPSALFHLRISLRILASGHIKLCVPPKLPPLYILRAHNFLCSSLSIKLCTQARRSRCVRVRISSVMRTSTQILLNLTNQALAP